MNDWTPGDLPPTNHGYYLATWLRGVDKIPTVSELWFNRDATPKWWRNRGYLDGHHDGMAGAIGYVIAWQQLPKPYTPPQEPDNA